MNLRFSNYAITSFDTIITFIAKFEDIYIYAIDVGLNQEGIFMYI